MKDRDHFFWKAKEEGYASRAAYKLQEIQKSHRLLHEGDRVLELGAAPGGWSEIIAPLIGSRGRLFCVDLQPMQVAGWGNAEFFQGDFTDSAFIEKLQREVGGVDVLLSDAAPSTSGVHFGDAARSAELCHAALALAPLMLKPGGSFLVKIFAGEEQDFLKACELLFEKVKRLKPEASKKKSREFYVLAQGFQPI